MDRATSPDKPPWLNLDVHPQPLAGRVLDQRRHRHRVIGVELITGNGQVLLGIFIGLTPAFLLFLLAPLFFAQH